jgi:hypothetical protein
MIGYLCVLFEGEHCIRDGLWEEKEEHKNDERGSKEEFGEGGLKTKVENLKVQWNRVGKR